MLHSRPSSPAGKTHKALIPFYDHTAEARQDWPCDVTAPVVAISLGTLGVRKRGKAPFDKPPHRTPVTRICHQCMKFNTLYYYGEGKYMQKTLLLKSEPRKIISLHSAASLK